MLYELESKLLEVKKSIELIEDDKYALRKHNLHLTLSYDEGKKQALVETKKWLETMIDKFPK